MVLAKNLKDKRANKAIEELFDSADKNGNGKISVKEYVNIFSEHGVTVNDEEIKKVSHLANDNGEVKREFNVFNLPYSKTFNAYIHAKLQKEFVAVFIRCPFGVNNKKPNWRTKLAYINKLSPIYCTSLR